MMRLKIYLLNTVITGKLLSEILIQAGIVTGIIMLSDEGRYQTNEYFDYTTLCENHSLECIKVNSYKFDDDDRMQLEPLDIDLIIVAGWQRLIPEWLINKCNIGVIGAHGSHEGIEKGRGRSPQNWAILAGCRSFSVSIFWITPGIDDGKVIDTKNFNYSNCDTIMTSHIKVDIYIANMIIDNINNGKIQNKVGTNQGDGVYYLPQRIKTDGYIDWSRNSVSIYNFVRALTRPYPGAITKYSGKDVYIWSVIPIELDHYENTFGSYEDGGIISRYEDALLIKCGKGTVLVTDYSVDSSVEILEGQKFESAVYTDQVQAIIDRHNRRYGTPISELVFDELKK